MGCEGLEKIGFEAVGRDRIRIQNSLRRKKDPITLTLFVSNIELGKNIYQCDL